MGWAAHGRGAQACVADVSENGAQTAAMCRGNAYALGGDEDSI